MDALTWWLSDSRPRRTDREIRVLLTPVDRNLVPWPGNLAGTKLHYYDLTTAKVDVPFEFTNVALP